MCDTLDNKQRGEEVNMNGVCEGCEALSPVKQDEWGNWCCEECDPKLFIVRSKLVTKNGKTYLTGGVIDNLF